MGALDPEGSLTLADITGDLASGFDTIQNDYADVLNDPTQEFLNFIPHCPYCYTVNSQTQSRTVIQKRLKLNVETISNILTAVASESTILDQVITPEMIASASETVGGGIQQVVDSGLVDTTGDGFDLSSMIGDLTQAGFQIDASRSTYP